MKALKDIFFIWFYHNLVSPLSILVLMLFSFLIRKIVKSRIYFMYWVIITTTLVIYGDMIRRYFSLGIDERVTQYKTFWLYACASLPLNGFVTCFIILFIHLLVELLLKRISLRQYCRLLFIGIVLNLLANGAALFLLIVHLSGIFNNVHL